MIENFIIVHLTLTYESNFVSTMNTSTEMMNTLGKSFSRTCTARLVFQPAYPRLSISACDCSNEEGSCKSDFLLSVKDAFIGHYKTRHTQNSTMTNQLA